MLYRAHPQEQWEFPAEHRNSVGNYVDPEPRKRPKSAVSAATGALGLSVLATGLWLTLFLQLTVQQSILLCLVLPALVMVAWDIFVEKVHLRPDSGFDFSRSAPMRQTLRRSGVKLVGIWTTWAGEDGWLVTRRKQAEEVIAVDPPQLLVGTADGEREWDYPPFTQTFEMWGPFPMSGEWGERAGYVVLARQTQPPFTITAERHFVPEVGMVREIIVQAVAGRMMSRQEMELVSKRN